MTDHAPSVCADLHAWVQGQDQLDGPIGGFMGLDVHTLPRPAHSILAHWVGDAATALGFHNVRSALVHLVKHRAAQGAAQSTVWLPAYTCPSLPAALAHHGLAHNYYRINADLSVPDDAFEAIAGTDTVVLMNYFGRPAQLGKALASLPPNCLRIEDCAQTIHTGQAAQAPWRLYSARKMLAVPDGGLLIGDHEATLTPDFIAWHDTRFMAAVINRGEDPAALHNQYWYQAHQTEEASGLVGDYPISRLSAALLARSDAQIIIDRRRQNYQKLVKSLTDKALWPDETAPDWVPFCYPVLVDDPARVGRRMAEKGVFVPRYWPVIPAPDTREFDPAHKLANSLLALPCDQRYDTTAMGRVIDVFRDVTGA